MAEEHESATEAPEPGTLTARAEVAPVGFTYYFARAVLVPLTRLIYRPRVEGRGNIPRKGKVIFASNHLSFIDSMIIPMFAPRPVYFLAKSSYFDGPGFRGWLSRQIFTAIGATLTVLWAIVTKKEAATTARVLLLCLLVGSCCCCCWLLAD